MAAAKTVATEDLVSVTIPLTAEKQDDVFVQVNGVAFQIQRGEEVKVPRNVYNVLKRSQQMDALAIKRSKAREQ